MIYTVTLNPALDYVVTMNELTVGALNRTESEDIFVGGKGLNVSLMLHRLGVPTCALGFLAGFTGEEIERRMTRAGVACEFIRLPSGTSRINVKLKAREETELNGQGPHIPPEAWEALCQRIARLTDGDTLVLSGSIPPALPSEAYALLLARVPAGVRTVVDAAGNALRSVLPYGPFLIKPNREELSRLFDRPLTSLSDIEACARELREQGAHNVLVSLAGDGALLIDEHRRCHIAPAFPGTAVNSVGAGDSMVAGFLAGCESKTAGRPDYPHALKLGSAAGAATAFSRDLGTKEAILALLKTV